MNSRDLGKFLVLLVLATIGGLIALVVALASNGTALVTWIVLSTIGALYPLILKSSFFESFVTLLESFFFRASQDRDRSGKGVILKQEAIINLYYKQQSRELFNIFIVVLLTIAVCSTASIFLKVQLPVLQISLVLFILLVLLYLKNLFIEYRIILLKVICTNRYEATEIIKFIQKSIDKLDSSGGNKIRVFPSIVLETLRTDISSQDSGENF